MIPAEAIQIIGQFGSTGLLLLILNAIWTELKVQNQFNRDIVLKLQGADDEREKLRAEIQQLKDERNRQPAN